MVAYFPYDFFSDGLYVLFALFEEGAEISSWAVLHNDEYFGGFLIDDSILIAYDVGVFESFEEVDFCDELLFLATGHFFEVDLFPHQGFTVSDSFDLPDYSEGTLAYLF